MSSIITAKLTTFRRHELILLLAVGLLVAASGAKAAGVHVAVGQFPSLSGATPARTMLLNAERIAALAINASSSGNTTSGSSLPPLELMTFPEFALLGPSAQLSELCDGHANAALQPYCEIDIPAIGEAVNCSTFGTNAGDGEVAPIVAIACAVNQAAPLLAVSYNTCYRNVSSGLLYNLQVVVAGGRVLAAYPKMHPFYTKCFAPPPEPVLSTFETLHSGHRFGLFTCFDILFPHPKEDLVAMGVRYFSYSSAIPLVGRAAVELFAATNNVSVVSADQSGGSAIIAAPHAAVLAECPLFSSNNNPSEHRPTSRRQSRGGALGRFLRRNVNNNNNKLQGPHREGSGESSSPSLGGGANNAPLLLSSSAEGVCVLHAVLP